MDMLTAEAIGSTGESVDMPDTTGTMAAPRTAPMWSGGAWRDVPIIDRADIATGQTVEGPAILTELTGTNILEDGWQATCAAGGNLILTRAVPLARQEAI